MTGSQTHTHTACRLEDSEDIHRQHFRFVYSSSSSPTLTFAKCLVCLSPSWGCRTAPPVISLTHAHTQSLSVFLYSALRRFTVRNKALSRPYLPSTQLSPPIHLLQPLYFGLNSRLFGDQSPNTKIQKF